jgi:tetratricopeptide (TPR) repeat protein
MKKQSAPTSHHHQHAPLIEPPPSSETGLVMHDPEKDQTALLRWLRHHADKTWFRTLCLAVVALPIAGVIWYNTYGGFASRNDRGWMDLVNAPTLVSNELEARKSSSSFEEQQVEFWDRTGEEFGEVANKYPSAPVAPWAALRAGGEYFNAGVMSLPRDHEAAQASLEKAAKQYQRVVELAKKGSYLARLGELGYARSLEAQKDLDGAIKAYQALAKAAPDSAEGKQAEALAKRLESPEARKFYDDLYAFKATPPPSIDNLPPIAPGPPGEPVVIPPPPSGKAEEAPKPAEAPSKPAEEPAKPAPTPVPEPVKPPAEEPAKPAAEEMKKPAEPEAAKPAPELPNEVFAPEAAKEKEAEPKKAEEAPKPAPAEEPKKPAEGEIPANPFAPEPK